MPDTNVITVGASPIVPATAPEPARSSVTVEMLVRAFLSGRNANTIRAYRRGLEQFAEFCGEQTVAGAARRLLGQHPGDAHALVLSYQAHLTDKSASTANARVAAVRSLVTLANQFGVVTWTLKIKNKKPKKPDMRGCGFDGYLKLLATAQTHPNPVKAARDVALIRLMFDRALRRGEILAGDVSDFDAANCRIQILGKGQDEPEWLTLPEPTTQAIADWLKYRRAAAGPLFHGLTDKGEIRHGKRLSQKGIWKVIRSLGRKAGLGDVRPHGLRHAAITTALERTNGNIREVAKFARHKRIETTVMYDDARRDMGGTIAAILAAS